MDSVLNLLFFAFHTSWMAFNAVGWAWRRTRRAHLVTMGLTALAWFGLGYWYGWGYCPCTDWHWMVRARLGYRDDPHSYVQLLVRELSGWEPSRFWADLVTVSVFLVAGVLSVVLNVRDWRSRR